MIHMESWTRSDLGTPIALFASHTLTELKTKKPLLLMGGVHGDEPLGVLLAQQTLDFLKADNGKDVCLPWILIPCLNVDGYRNNTRVNGRGVDLNRNYPSKSWSPAFEKERYNPGPEPGSEAEVKGVVDLIQTYKPRLIIHCHSWKPMVVCAGEPGKRDAERLSRSSGYEVVPEIGYPTPGSLSQFGWWDNQIPVICIEEADESKPNSVWPRFQDGMREIFLDASNR
jgi:murein peptide amidase A